MEKSQFIQLRDDFKKSVLRTPTVTSATLLPNGYISVTKSTKSPQEGKSISTSTTMKINTEEESIQPLNHTTINDEKIIANSFSPSKTKIAVLKQVDAKAPSYTLEIWESGLISKKIKIEGHHKDVCNNGFIVFKTLDWSQDETKLIYMAEKNPKKIDIWKDVEEDDDFDIENYLGVNEYKHNWGESAFKFSDLEIFIFDLESEKIFKVKGLKEGARATYAKFVGKEGKDICYVGIKGEFASGVQFCMNKDSAIYLLEDYETEEQGKKKKKEEKKSEIKEDNEEEEKKEDEVKTAVKISQDSDATSLFPIPSPSGDVIAYIYTSDYNENHLFTTGLKFFRRSTNEHKVIQNELEEDPENLAFYIYNGLGSDKYKWTQEHLLYLPSHEKAMPILNRIDFDKLERKKYVFEFDFDTDPASILDYSDTGLLVKYSNFYHTTRLVYIDHFEELFEETQENLKFYYSPEKTKNLCPSDILASETPVKEHKLSFRDLTGYLWHLESTNPQENPCLVFLHGGPHSYTSVPSTPFFKLLLKNNYSILTLNFSGSWTYGKKINERLAGKIGEIDIEEVIELINQLQGEGKIGKTLDFWGWSYSGYQGFALLQKHPHVFRKMMIANPVVNLLYMQYSSDIPEWIFHEGLGTGEKFTYKRDLTEEEILKMKKLSPGMLEFDGTSKTKVLFLLGDSDLRVTPRAGVYLYKKLKKVGIDIELKSYEGQNHSIRKVDLEFDHKICTLNFYLSE